MHTCAHAYMYTCAERERERGRRERETYINANSCMHACTNVQVISRRFFRFPGPTSCSPRTGKKDRNRKHKHNELRTNQTHVAVTELGGGVTNRKRRNERVASDALGNEDMEMPHIILVDGGKGQLSAVTAAFQRMGAYSGVIGAERVAFVSLAKQREEVHVPGVDGPLMVEGGMGSAAMLLLRRCRDEAHAFAGICM